MVVIENNNKTLKGVLPKNFARPEFDERRLGKVVDLFTDVFMHDHTENKDILERTYEYCLSKLIYRKGN